MVEINRVIKCYDTMTGQYVDVLVTEEVETYIKRSYWREDMQERRFYKRKKDLDENLNYEANGGMDVVDQLIMKEDIEVLLRAINKLNERKRLLVYYVYYKKLSLCETAKILGVSSSYMSRLVRQVHEELREIIGELGID